MVAENCAASDASSRPVRFASQLNIHALSGFLTSPALPANNGPKASTASQTTGQPTACGNIPAPRKCSTQSTSAPALNSQMTFLASVEPHQAWLTDIPPSQRLSVEATPANGTFRTSVHNAASSLSAKSTPKRSATYTTRTSCPAANIALMECSERGRRRHGLYGKTAQMVTKRLRSTYLA